MTIMSMKSAGLVKNKIFQEQYTIVAMQLRKRRIKRYYQTINNRHKVNIMPNGKILISNRCLLCRKDPKISKNIR